MSRVYILFSVNEDNGEADLTKNSECILRDWIEHDPLFAADILKDISGLSAQLYQMALDSLASEWERKCNAAAKTSEEA